MKIVRYKKMSKGRYKLTLDNTELILYEDVILKNNLLRTSNINLELLEKVMNENIYYEIYNMALTYIEIKMRTSKEIKDYLNKKNFNTKLIDEVLDRLNKEGYLNEEKYIDAFVNDKVNLTNWGPYKIKKSLLDLELDETLINNKLNTINENIWNGKIEKIINKKLNSLKNKSNYMIKNKLKIDLYNLGYDNNSIEENLNNLNLNNNENIKKEYSKAYNKYSKKYMDQELYQKVKSYLYRKGYKIEEINYMLDNLE